MLGGRVGNPFCPRLEISIGFDERMRHDLLLSTPRRGVSVGYRVKEYLSIRGRTDVETTNDGGNED